MSFARFDTPILVVAFNRPEHTHKVLERIKQLRPKKLFFCCDGPRKDNEHDKRANLLIRRSISEINWVDDLKLLLRDENLGCKMSVSGAISWFFNHVESGIILEDDCVPDLSFFTYCEILLAKYELDDRILQIAGTCHLQKVKGITDSYFFSHFPLIHGWATWKRAWSEMDLAMTSLGAQSFETRLNSFLPNNTAVNYIMDKFLKSKAGTLNSWAYPWFYSIVNANGLCIIPHINLVENIGLGGQATHTSRKTRRFELSAAQINLPMVHPTAIEVRNVQREYQVFYNTQKKRSILLLYMLFSRRFVQTVSRTLYSILDRF